MVGNFLLEKQADRKKKTKRLITVFFFWKKLEI